MLAESQTNFLDVTTGEHLWNYDVVEKVLSSTFLDVDFVVEHQHRQLLDAIAWNLDDIVGFQDTARFDFDREGCACNVFCFAAKFSLVSNDDHVAFAHDWRQVEVINLDFLARRRDISAISSNLDNVTLLKHDWLGNVRCSD